MELNQMNGESVPVQLTARVRRNNPQGAKPMEAASVASAAAEVGLDDLSSPLRWLAWRHPALEAYEPRWCAGGPEHDKHALGRANCGE